MRSTDPSRAEARRQGIGIEWPGEEELIVDSCFLCPQLAQGAPNGHHHVVRTAEVPAIDLPPAEQAVVDNADLGVVDAAGEKWQIGALPAEEVKQLETAGVAVLQALQFLEEHHGVGRSVPVEKGP